MKPVPVYRRPTRDESTARVPRLVNAAWLVMALRDNARFTAAEDVLPWHDGDLYRRAATQIEQLTRSRP